MNAKKAFTLIELLVVIAIIAILAAILFPVFAQAKAAAKSAVSVSNMKQIGLGLAMYEGDADDMMPLGRVYGASGNIGLPVLLGPYIQKVANKASGDTTPVSTATIWHSPLDSVTPQSFTFTPTAGSPLVKQTYDHIYSTTAAGRAAWDSDVQDATSGNYYQPGKSATVFGAPANTFVIAESLMPSLVLGGNNPGIKRPWDPSSSLSDYAGSKEGNGDYLGQDCNALNGTDTSCKAVLNRKMPTGIDSGGGWNYLFADSHVKSMKPTATVGTGVNGTGKDAAGNTCGARFPCGPWTVDDTD